ncbi:MAG: SH3 domain-containing protein [Anaerolineales bacterium]|nr:SH3 domain-containing protein [Anaerolineales bacterium]
MDYNSLVFKQLTILITASLMLISTACNAAESAPVEFVITSTLPPTLTPQATATPAPATITATPVPVEGKTTTQLNVRAEPSTGSAVLGLIAPFVKVQIFGKDPSGSWLQIAYAQGTDGKGWVTAAYVQVNASAEIPVIGNAAGSGSRLSGLVIQQLNVRSGPGTDYNSLGVLNPNDVVYLSGKNDAGSWLQIEFSGGVEGKGWVSTAFIKADGADGLPIVAETGRAVGTETPTGIPPSPMPMLIPAKNDGDSAEAPAVNVSFSPNGTRALLYSNDLSSPEGDSEDWIQFTPYQPGVLVQLSCAGNGEVSAEIVQDGEALPGFVKCSESGIYMLNSGQAYLIHLSTISPDVLQYTSYTLKVANIQP